MTKAVQTGLLWVSTNELSAEHLANIKQAYTYRHPFEEAKTFETFVEHNGKLGIPTGDKSKVALTLGSDCVFDITDKTIAPEVDKQFEFRWDLRDYQKDTHKQITEYLEKGGTEFNLRGPCGSGKSIYLAALLAHLGVKTLVLAHMSMLTEQLHKELSGSTTADVRILSAKNQELGDINIATSQFISCNPDLWKEIKHNIGCIVVDEAESLASMTTLRIVQRSHAKYNIFISATFSRPTDGRTEALTDFAGHSSFTLDNSAYNIPAHVMMVQCEEQFPRFVSKNTYVKAKQKFFKKESIKDKIDLMLEASLAKDRQVLIAVDIINLQDALAERYAEYGVGVLNSNTKKKDRTRILEEYDNGILKVLIAASVVNAGLSIPKISTIIRVSFPSSETKSVQLVGRAQRPLEGKDKAYVFDLVFKGQNPAKRVKAYRETGYIVTRHTWEQVETKLKGD